MSKRVNILAVVVVAAVVVAAGAMIAVPRMAGAPAAGDLRAVVHDGDGGTRELPLAQDGETAITTSFGTNVVVVEGGAVFVREADCPNHDCVRQGRIDTPGQQVVCLPHQLWIEVVASGDGGTGGLDVTSR